MTDDATAARSLLDSRHHVETPERVELTYDLAGIGSRFAAGTVDAFILMLVFLVLAAIAMVSDAVVAPRGETARLGYILTWVSIFSLTVFLYYAGFEWAWSGRTPGKRMLRLRVVTETGAPAPFGAIFVRNLLRIADALPLAPPFAVGGLVMFVNARSKRIGDYAAGTIVIRERTDTVTLLAAPPQPGAPGDEFGPAEVLRAREFLARSRELFAARREALARQVAAAIAAPYQLEVDDPVEFLRLVAAGASVRRLRERAGRFA